MKALRKDDGSSALAGCCHLLLTRLAVTLLALLAAACSGNGSGGSGAPAAPPEAAPSANVPGTGSHDERTEATDVLITTYRSPTCGCCEGYERYLEDEGFEVESIFMDDMTEVKDNFGVPADMRSCHTALVSDYFVEGHVPVEAIRRLLEERPAINGIALPRMPSGSPGMGGDKQEPFVIYAIADGKVDEFMTL